MDEHEESRKTMERMHEKSKDDIIKDMSKKNKKYKGALTILAIVAVAIISFNLGSNNGGDSGGTGGVILPSQGGNAPSPIAPKVNLDIGDDPVKGDPDAPVTIIEFSDFECPFCGRFYSDTLGQLEKEYIDTGKVKFVYKDFPLSFHPQAEPAAVAASCAGEQGKFWEYHDKIFDNQASLSSGSYTTWASELGLDASKFKECVDSGKYEAEIQEDIKEGSAAGVKGTPAFFINGQLVSGAQPFSVFQQAIEAAL